jgi:exosome complex RNA-binding protein Csl4
MGRLTIDYITSEVRNIRKHGQTVNGNVQTVNGDIQHVRMSQLQDLARDLENLNNRVDVVSG